MTGHFWGSVPLVSFYMGGRNMQETILVVDDEREITDLLEVYLSNEGFRVIKAYNGRSALAAIEQEKDKMDLAILDIMLPDIDGFTLCRKIRENHFFPLRWEFVRMY